MGWRRERGWKRDEGGSNAAGRLALRVFCGYTAFNRAVRLRSATALWRSVGKKKCADCHD
jgi:hypothetical protein